MSGAEKAPINLQISMQMNSENVTIVSPQPLEVIGAQFDFKFIDTVSAFSRAICALTSELTKRLLLPGVQPVSAGER